MIRNVGDWILLASAFIISLSLLVQMRVRWWKSQTGLMLTALLFDFSLVLDLGAARIIFDIGDAPWFSLLRLITFTPVPFVLAWLLFLQMTAQRGAHPKGKPE